MLKAIVNSPVSFGDQTIINGNLIIGTAGKGIDFSDDPSAPGMTSELLDDYEEGAFTPALQFGGAAVDITYSVQQGLYTKIGNRVYFTIRLTLTNKGTSVGNAAIVGLPFAANASTRFNPMSVWWTNMATGLQPFFFVDTNSTTITCQVNNSGSSANSANGSYNNNSNITISGSYQV